MATLAEKQDFMKKHFRWYYSEGPAKREDYTEAAKVAWASYEETGKIPWEVTTPTTPTGITDPTGGYPAVPSIKTTTSVSPEYDIWLEERNRLKAEHEAKIGVTTPPTTTPTAPTPTFGAGAAAAIPTQALCCCCLLICLYLHFG